MRKLLVTALFVSIMTSGFCVVGGNGDKAKAKDPAEAEMEKAAVSAAESWLKLIDDGEYAKSYQESAPPMRDLVTEDNWVKGVAGARKLMGGLVSRKILGCNYLERLPGAPDGKYVVIRFETVFKNKRKAIETVTPMLVDGKWLVSGYYIK